MSTQVVILAAGQGKRMFSKIPKVLQPLAGKPLLQHVIETAKHVSGKKPIVVIGHQGGKVRESFSHDVKWVEQAEQLGTGHALLQALPFVADEDNVLVLYGDVPLISISTLKKVCETVEHNAMSMLTAELENPKGYGRIKRDAKQNVIGIVEEKDASDTERSIREINPGIYYVPANYLKKWLPMLGNYNAQKEYYLTEIILHAVKENISITTIAPEYTEEILGVNDFEQLSFLERFHQRQMANELMRKGVRIVDPSRLDIRGEVTIGHDVVIDVNVILAEKVVIGDDCKIGAGCMLRNTELGNGVKIKPYTIIDGAKIADHCVIGPYARIRPETVLSEEVHIGNFVEVKKSQIGKGTKANHLSYIGDAEIGTKVNVGAGTITCNYDGHKKHKTIIGDHVFIGSDTQLIAPVTIGDGATIGAGSTIVEDAPAHALTLSRVPQKSVDGWKKKG